MIQFVIHVKIPLLRSHICSVLNIFLVLLLNQWEGVQEWQRYNKKTKYKNVFYDSILEIIQINYMVFKPYFSEEKLGKITYNTTVHECLPYLETKTISIPRYLYQC